MRFFTALAAFGLVALATAQNATTTARNATSLTSTSVASNTASLDPQVRCLQSCGSADVCCQAKCVGVPCPSQSQANATTSCIAKCPQGNGTASETEKYADCEAACVSSYYMSSSATPVPTASETGTNSASATPFSFGSSTADGSGAASTGGSATGASASASATGDSGNGADSLHIGTVAFGFMALVMTALAL